MINVVQFAMEIEVLIARLIILVFVAFCFFAFESIRKKLVDGSKPKDTSKFVIVLGNLIVLLPLIAAIPGWAIGIPPAPILVLKEVNVFFGVQILVIFVAMEIGLQFRSLFFQKNSRKCLIFTIQTVISGFIFLTPFAWTVSDGQLASIFTRSVERLDPKVCPDAGVPTLLAQISDLHVTSNGQPTREGDVPGNNFIDLVVASINKHQPAFLIVSGDITDSGAATEWSDVLESLAKVSRNTTVVLTPGNHDLNLWFGREDVTPAPNDDNHNFISRLDEIPKIARVYAVQDSLSPSITSKRGLTLGDDLSRAPTRTTASSFTSEIAECTKDCLSTLPKDPNLGDPSLGCYLNCKDNWAYIRNLYLRNLDRDFPWRLTDLQKGVSILSIATALRTTATIGQNAIGEIDDEQISAVQSAIESVPANVKTFIFIFHHPMTVIRGEMDNTPFLARIGTGTLTASRFFATWHTLEDSIWWDRLFLRTNPGQANKFIDLLQAEMHRRGDARGIVMFGHRHRRTLGIWNKLVFVEAPNLSHAPPDRGFYLVTNEDEPTPSWCNLGSN
jgi:hypothetical protein